MLYDKVYINPIHSNFPKTKEEPVGHLVILKAHKAIRLL